jgi:hypothetical protein
VEEKKYKKEDNIRIGKQLEQERKDKYELYTSILKRVLKRRVNDIDFAGDATTIKLNDKSLRDIAVYRGSYLGHSYKQALANSALIIINLNAAFKRHFKL